MPGTYEIPHQRPGLGRHVHHDPQSRRFPYVRRAAADDTYRPAAVFHPRYIPIFNQGQLGKCTAETVLGLLGTGPYWERLVALYGGELSGVGGYNFNDVGTTALYEDITANDPFEGQYPPTDTGSDGLSAAKALMRVGAIPGYQHAFGLTEALRALADFPLAVGTLWTDSMFYPSRNGLIRYAGSGEAVGGHEWIADQYDPVRDWVGGTTSWGAGFGINGRFYLTAGDFGRLLADDGDVIVLALPSAAPPVPDVPAAEEDSADAVLAQAMRTWLTAKDL